MFALAFFLCLIAQVLQSVLGLKITFLTFAPFVAFGLLKANLRLGLWLAALAGFFVDLFSEDPMGLHALNYTMTAGILYGIKRRFSYEEPIHLGICTGMVSFVSTLLQLFLLFLFDRRVPIHGKWILVDLFCMPVVDGIYGLVWLWGPLWVVKRLRYKWTVYCLRKNLSRT